MTPSVLWVICRWRTKHREPDVVSALELRQSLGERQRRAAHLPNKAVQPTRAAEPISQWEGRVVGPCG